MIMKNATGLKMGKRNCAMNSTCIKSKRPQQQPEQEKRGKSTKRHCSRIKNELDDVDSLAFLRDSTEKKELIGIDDKIKLLKTELMSLFGNTIKVKNSQCFIGKDNAVGNTSSNCDLENLEDLETEILPSGNTEKPGEPLTDGSKTFKPDLNSTPSKFSEWLENTIDDMESESKDKKFEENELKSKSELLVSPVPKILPINLPSPDSHSGSFSLLSLPQQKVEQLLYKSFLMQNSNLYVLNSGQNSLNQTKPIKSITQNDGKFTPRNKYDWGKFVKSNSRKTKRISQRARKRMKTNSSFSQTEVEVINLDSSSSNSTPKTNTDYIDLDISNYDWNEPFDMPDDTESPSVQVIEDSDKEDFPQPECKSDIIEVMEGDESIPFNDAKNLEKKKTWECPICFEPSKGQDIVATQCGHIFCQKCIQNHISNFKNDCPSCRCSLKNKPFITLFNF